MSKYTIRHDKVEKGQALANDGKFALGMLAGIVFAVFFVLGVEAVSQGISREEILDVAPVIVSLLVAGLSATLSARALYEQRRAREASTDPILIAHLGQRADAPELVTFNVTNIGAGAALNVRLTVDLPEEDVKARHFLQNIFAYHHPFTVIPQGSAIEFPFGLGWDLLEDHPFPPFGAKVDYEDLSGGRYSSEFTLDVREMEKLGTQRSPEMRKVKALEKIADHLARRK